MLGRGTRKGEKFPDKSHFTVFDCFDGTLLAYFRNATGLTADPPDKPSRTIKEIIDDIWANRDRDFNIRCLVKRLQRIEKEMAGEARELFAAFGIKDGDVGRYAAALPDSLRRDFTGVMRLLRSDKFQELLENYPRRKKVFLKALENEDTVVSEYLIRDGLGNEYKPEDYLEAFDRFVRENPAKVQAIQILLNRPKDWGTKALDELRKKLASTPEHFTVDLLQKAHQIRYDKALVDIISMVKHAASDQEPLLTAEERVERAFQKLAAGRRFTPEQELWLDRIRQHLIANLSIEQDDFESIPILAEPGGWKPANRVFDGQLHKLLESLNEAVAA
jgi:type I restriction enzyme R subunit